MILRNLGAALAGAVAISFSAIFVRAASVTPVTAGFFRTAYAVPVLFLLWWRRRDQDQRSHLERGVAALAGLALAADLISWHASISYIGAGLATLLANTQVVFVTLVAWLLLRERPSRTALAALPVVLAGVAAISGLGSEQAFGERPVAGAVLGLVAAIFYSVFLLGYRRANRGLGPAAGSLLDATAGAAVGVAVAGMLSATLDLRPSWPEHGWLLALALVAQVGGWLLIGYALPRLPARHTSFLILLQPVLTMVWGALLFGERVSAVQLAGVLLVLTGVAAVVAENAGLRRRRSG